MNTSALVAGGLVGLTAESFNIQSQRSRNISALSTAIDLESRSRADRDASPDLERAADSHMLEPLDQSLRMGNLGQPSKEAGDDPLLDSSSIPSDGIIRSVESDATQRRLFNESEGDGSGESDQVDRQQPHVSDDRLVSDDNSASISSGESGYLQPSSSRIWPNGDKMQAQSELRNDDAIPEMKQSDTTKDSAAGTPGLSNGKSIEDESKSLARDTDSETSKLLTASKEAPAVDKPFLKPPKEAKMMIKESVSLINGIGQVRRIQRSFMGLLVKGLNQIEGIVSRRNHETPEETTVLRSLQQEPSTDTNVTGLSMASRGHRHRSSSLRKRSIAAGTRGREALSKRQSEAWLQETCGKMPRNLLHKVV